MPLPLASYDQNPGHVSIIHGFAISTYPTSIGAQRVANPLEDREQKSGRNGSQRGADECGGFRATASSKTVVLPCKGGSPRHDCNAHTHAHTRLYSICSRKQLTLVVRLDASLSASTRRL